MRASEVCVVVAAMLCCGAAPRISSVPPSADSDVKLSDGRVLHVLELPLARLDGVVLDGATFDTSGARVVLLARFPTGAINGDYRRASPTQAYIVDVSRRTLTQLTTDGLATAVRWSGPSRVTVTDDGKSSPFDVGNAQAGSVRGGIRIDRVTASTNGTLVSPASEFRLQVLKEDEGSYAVGQVGAVRLRTIAESGDHRLALVGSFIAWIDASKSHGASFSRIGPDDVLPPSFDDEYGKTLNPILPLGHPTYQGAYRDGVAYFAFAYGLQRIVAATTDFVTYSFPSLPAQPDYTVGDGLGAGADGVLYFADPENRVVQIWRNGRYVEFPLTFPDNVSDTSRLFRAIPPLTSGDRPFPPVDPDQDALEAAIMEWRIYPLGDVTGQGWVASYLGRAYVSGADRRFHEISEPAFPFAVLSRTDDGRIWGASIQMRYVRDGSVVRTESRIWSSRDGVNWSDWGDIGGSPGAVSLHGGRIWIALSGFEDDAPGVEIWAQDSTHILGQPIGAVYAGEDLFFADVASGFYVICGGEPGTRPDNTSGPLAAFRLDTTSIAASEFLRTLWGGRIQPIPASQGSVTSRAFAQPSLAALADRNDATISTVVDADSPGYTNCCLLSEPVGIIGSMRCCRWMTPDFLRRFELEYAWTPYPLARVSADERGDSATVTRTLELGPLSISGRRESWHRDAPGGWSLSAILERWMI